MLSYMEHIERVFLEKCGLGLDDSYSNLLLTSAAILDFRVPEGLSVSLGSQASPNTFNTYTFRDLTNISGSMAYLYSSLPVPIVPTRDAPLPILSERFQTTASKTAAPQRASLLYGKMFTGRALEAMAIQKWGSKQLVAKWVCDPRLPKPVILTSTLQMLGDRSVTELIYSSHENLFGVQSLINVAEWRETNAKLCAGFEAFYAASKTAPGISIAGRYSTYSKYTATPLTITGVLNPLMGNVSVAYALKPTPLSALSSRFDFNFYSYESDLSFGCELWRTKPISLLATSGAMSVFKASTSLASQSAQLLWETSFKEILVSTGCRFCYGNLSPIGFGIEFVYASAPNPPPQ